MEEAREDERREGITGRISSQAFFRPFSLLHLLSFLFSACLHALGSPSLSPLLSPSCCCIMSCTQESALTLSEEIMATPRDTRWRNHEQAIKISIEKRNRPGRGWAPVPARRRGRNGLHGKGQVGNDLRLEMLFSDAI